MDNLRVNLKKNVSRSRCILPTRSSCARFFTLINSINNLRQFNLSNSHVSSFIRVSIAVACARSSSAATKIDARRFVSQIPSRRSVGATWAAAQSRCSRVTKAMDYRDVPFARRARCVMFCLSTFSHILAPLCLFWKSDVPPAGKLALRGSSVLEPWLRFRNTFLSLFQPIIKNLRWHARAYLSAHVYACRRLTSSTSLKYVAVATRRAASGTREVSERAKSTTRQPRWHTMRTPEITARYKRRRRRGAPLLYMPEERRRAGRALLPSAIISAPGPWGSLVLFTQSEWRCGPRAGHRRAMGGHAWTRACVRIAGDREPRDARREGGGEKLPRAPGVGGLHRGIQPFFFQAFLFFLFFFFFFATACYWGKAAGKRVHVLLALNILPRKI